MGPPPAARRLGAALATITAVLSVALGPPAVDPRTHEPPARDRAAPGHAVPAAVPTVPLDVFAATAHEVRRVRADGREPVCEVPVARWEPHRPDAGRFPAPLIGRPVGDGTDARWLRPAGWGRLAPVLADRLQLCRDKGFDWISVDGFPPYHPAHRRYAEQLADLVQERGLTVVAPWPGGRTATGLPSAWTRLAPRAGV